MRIRRKHSEALEKRIEPLQCQVRVKSKREKKRKQVNVKAEKLTTESHQAY